MKLRPPGPPSSRLGLAVVVALAVASILPAPFATLWPDTIRDLSASLAFARGEALPLAGPSINFGPHLGPAWIWLQGLALVFQPSLVAASLFVAAIAALKFPLLYWLGKVLSGERLGLCFAVAAAFPSIATYQWMVFFHPNWVEVAVAAALLASAAALKRRSLGLVYLGAAALGFAIQMHPTSLFYAPVVAWALIVVSGGGGRLALHAAATGALALAWFAPLLFAGDLGQREGVQDVSSRVATALASFSVSDVATVLRTAYADVPVAVGATYAARLGVPGWSWNAALLFVAAVAASGIVARLAESGARRWFHLGLLLALVAGWAAATAVRSYTSFYLAYFLLPLSAIVMGAGLERVASSPHPAWRRIGEAAVAVSALCFVAASAGAYRVGADARMHSRLPLLADLRHPGPAPVRATLATAAARDAAARFLCDSAATATLHGELAYAFAGGTGLDFRLHCPAMAAQVRILGSSGPALALTALARDDAAALGRAPAESFSGLAAFRVRQVLHPEQGRPIERDWYYFERLRDRAPMTRVVLDFTAPQGSHVVVYRLKPFDSRFDSYRVIRDALPASAAVSTYNSETYASSASAASRWRIEFETDAPGWVDVHVF